MKIEYPTPTLFVDLDKIDHNLNTICKKGGITPDKVIAVVKDSGYGSGSLEIAKSLIVQGVKTFAVAAMDEAIFLRDNGIKEQILLLGFASECDCEAALIHNIIVSIVDPIQLEFLSTKDKLPQIHILIDTGMTRNGLRYDELMEGDFSNTLIPVIPYINGIYTHYHSSDQNDQDATTLQKNRFSEAVDYLKDMGVSNAVTHSSNSGAIFFGSVPNGEMVRPGIALHGAVVDEDGNPSFGLVEATTLCSTVTSIRKVHEGEGVSYNHLYVAEQSGTIATIPVGYGDGFSRSFTGRGAVLIRGKRYSIIARVTMDFVLIDVGDDPVQVGDKVTLFGKDGEEEITVCELASAINTIPYEILCQIGNGANHHYHRSGTTVKVSPRKVY